MINSNFDVKICLDWGFWVLMLAIILLLVLKPTSQEIGAIIAKKK